MLNPRVLGLKNRERESDFRRSCGLFGGAEATTALRLGSQLIRVIEDGGERAVWSREEGSRGVDFMTRLCAESSDYGVSLRDEQFAD